MSSSRSPRGTPRLIALDWGTTSLRAYLLGDDGVVLERRTEPWGLLQLPDRDFGAAYRRTIGEWSNRHPGLRTLACGMVGSAQGWVETPYVPTPAGIAEISRALASVPDSELRIVPGVARLGDSPNVMRGEETQILGALAMRPELAERSLVVLPGTHSKWVNVVGGRLQEFSTFMTGELFGVLRAHSILGRFARGNSDVTQTSTASGAFARGVKIARAGRQGLAPLLFSARAAVLVGDLPPDESLDYLSGLLIGDEVRAGLADGRRPDALVGDPALCARYLAALELFDVGGIAVLDDTAPAGLWVIDQHASLGVQRDAGPSRSPVSGRAN
jgi:2-dehydro-3-deoxygalactonokinase